MATQAQRRVHAGLSLALSLAVSLAALWLALADIAHFSQTADIVDLSASLETGHGAQAAYLAKFTADHDALERAEDCTDAVSRARLTVSLAQLRQVDQSDVFQVTPALLRVIAMARARVLCSPVDGNAWLQWSTTQLRAAGPTPEVVKGLQRSALFAPSEAWILMPRLDIEAKLAAARVDGLDLLYGQDLRKFIEHEGVALVAAAYVGHDDDVRTRMRPLIQAQPVGRRHAIVAEIDRLGVDFSMP